MYKRQVWNYADSIICRYKNGEGSVKIAKSYGCSSSLILRILKDNNINIKKKSKDYVWQDSNQIIQRYLNKDKILAIAQDYNCSVELIRRILRSNNVNRETL